MINKRGLISLVMIVVITLVSLGGCKQKSQNESSSLNLYIDIKDNISADNLRKIIEEFQKKYSEIKIEYINSFGSKSENSIIQSINGSKKIDILVTSRNEMMKLSQNGLLSDLSKFYDKTDINKDYYSSFTNYGRYGDKYYGIGFMPHVMEIAFNKKALDKMGLKVPNSLKDIKPILKYMVSNNIKLPYITTGDMDINDLIYSFVGSNILDLSLLEKIYGSNSDNYKKIKDMQKVFDTIYSFEKEGLLNSNLFEKGTDSSISNLNSGNIPLLITTSSSNSSIDGDCDIIKDYSISEGNKEAVPVLVDSLICVPTNSKNSSETNDFLAFLYDIQTQQKIAKDGILSGNIKANEELKGINLEAAKLMKLSDLDNMLLFYNLPDKIRSGANLKISNIIKGKYTGNEWNEILQG